MWDESSELFKFVYRFVNVTVNVIYMDIQLQMAI